jgi:signal peptidase I
VIIFKHRGTFVVKRVVAAAGDIIEGRDKAIFINGLLLNEGYVEHTQSSVPGYEWMDKFGPIKVPLGKYFVIGDNRDVSLDSRSPDFGLVDEQSIVGKALYIFSSDREGTSIH